MALDVTFMNHGDTERTEMANRLVSLRVLCASVVSFFGNVTLKY